jgi:peptide/nickel transport system substrate-binding protein
MLEFQNQRRPGSGLSRRDVLRYGLAGAATLGTAGLLAACGANGEPIATSSESAGVPRRGGTLTVGFFTGGQTESLDPWKNFQSVDQMRVIQLYDTLFEYDDDLNVVPALAESAEPNEDGTEWTIRLRQGVVFHDGSPLTADDVLYNMEHWVQPDAKNYIQVGRFIDMARTVKVDDLTLRVGLTFSNQVFAPDLAYLESGIKSRNEKPGGEPIGTGPFRYSSFQPGSRSEFLAFSDHWRPDPVYIERLVIDSSFTSDTARVSALQSGQVDIIPYAPFGIAQTLDGGSTKLLEAASSAFTPFYMAVDTAPFDDVRVRQAMRLLVDRQAMVDVVQNGFGAVSNDVPGQNTHGFNSSLVRERDVDQAKFLLKQAGHDGLRLNLPTTQSGDALSQMSTLFKEQAAEGGVKIDIDQMETASFWSQYGQMPFAASLWYPVPSMDFVWKTSILFDAFTNETHWSNSPYADETRRLWYETRSTTDDSLRGELWNELQQQQFDAGGYINWGVMDYVDALSTKVQGLTPSKYFYASGYNFRKAWLSD